VLYRNPIHRFISFIISILMHINFFMKLNNYFKYTFIALFLSFFITLANKLTLGFFFKIFLFILLLYIFCTKLVQSGFIIKNKLRLKKKLTNGS